MKKEITLLVLLLNWAIFSSADPCSNIVSVTCGNPTTFEVTGNGDGNYQNFFAGCGSSSGLGGLEQVYKFKVSTTGTYQFSINSASGGYVEYAYKDSLNGCNNGGWTCLGVKNAAGALNTLDLTAGKIYYIILNSETSSTTSQTFTISCATVVCDNIIPITCGSAVTFTPSNSGYGSPAYPNFFAGCGSSSGLGGLEQIYKFKVPTTGTYQFTVNATTGSWFEYAFKDSLNGCSSTGWTCLGDRNTPGALNTLDLVAGKVYYIILNSESLGTTNSQTFTISCATVVCDNIIPVTCGTAVTFTPNGGYGSPSYSNGFVGGCYSSSGLGGQEKIYRLPPSSSNYQITINSAAGGYVEYLWKYDSLCCNNTGWNCIGVKNAPFTFAAINSKPGATVLLMLNAESIGTVTQNFQVSCSPLSISTLPCSIAASSGSICKGESVTLSVPGGYLTPGASWKWYKNSCGGSSVGTGISITVNPTATTTYYLRAEGTNTTLCLQKTITVNPIPEATVTKTGPTTFCKEENALLLTANAGAGFTYQWQKGANDLEGETGIIYTPTKSGTYKVIVTDQNGCFKQSEDVVVTVNDIPTAIITPLGPTTFCEGQSVVLQANTGAGLIYQWKLGGDNISGATNSSYTAIAGGKYKVKVKENINGCSKTSKFIKVTVNCKLVNSEEESLTALTMFPNPVTTEVNIAYKHAIDGKAEMKILNELGQIILKQEIMIESGMYSQAINISTLSKGIYFVEITSSSAGKMVGKFIKQ